MNKLLIKLQNIISKYPNLCFKFEVRDKYWILQDKFILGIVDSNGPIYYELDYILWDKFDVRTMPINYQIALYPRRNVLPSELNFDKVNYFHIDNYRLINYFGNVTDVVIPPNVEVISAHAFQNNNFIKRVRGASVKEIECQAFDNTNNLESLDFKNVQYINNLSNIPLLKQLTINSMLSFIQLENIPIENLTINIVEKINTGVYNYNSNLEQQFLEQNIMAKEHDKPLSLIYCGSDGSRKFDLKNEKDYYSSAIKGMCDFEFEWGYLRPHLKSFLSNLGYSFYLQKELNVNGLRREGLCLAARKIIIFDRRCIKNSFYHEIGHAIDYALGMISEQIECQNVFNLDRNQFNYFLRFMGITTGVVKDSQYDMNDINEFFAEGFNQYYINKTVLEYHCPNIYNYFKKLDEELKYKYNVKETAKKLVK